MYCVYILIKNGLLCLLCAPQVMGDIETTHKRMATDRCAYLTSVAIANKLYEAWISQHPALALVYLTQYFPDFSRW